MRDESSIRGNASVVTIPLSLEELQDAVHLANTLGDAVTVQGARTGICGGAVPSDGLIIDVSALNRVTGFSFDPTGEMPSTITVEAGVTLGQLNEMLAGKPPVSPYLDAESTALWQLYRESQTKLEFVPNPTELSATLGGMAATNVSGSHGWWGGNMRANVLAIEAVLPDSSLVRENYAHSGPDWRMESTISTCPGCRGDSSLIDLFCGSEGIVGAIAGLTLRLVRAPAFIWGMLSFFSSVGDLLHFVNLLRNKDDSEAKTRVRSVDFFDRGCMTFLATMRERMDGAKGLPEFPDSAMTACWLEFGGDDENALMEFLEKTAIGLEESNSPADLALVATNAKDCQRLSIIRHTLTEAANIACPAREGTLIDIGVPPDALSFSIDRLRALINDAGCAGILMGHLMDGQLTLRLLPDSSEQAEQAEMATRNHLIEMQRIGFRCGTIHGVGRIKKALFSSLCPPALTHTKNARDAMNLPNKWGQGTFFD